ncbi:MAG: hypothetical protein CME65_15180 [Halobacteriovoraceae bacterium]|nr:hypothetical protein [Halobacteriovoraceae bacterium]
MKKLISSLIVLSMTQAIAVENRSTQEISQKNSKNKPSKEEVLDNPTLKTLSGSLNTYSLYSSFTYRGASVSEPFGAERPNIRNADEVPGLVDASGVVGIKWRLSKSDNLSLQMGLYSTTPFHSSIETKNSRNERDFDENAGRVDADDPVLSYFKTYYIGNFQNISFLKYQHATRGIYRDFGLRNAFSFSQASAYRLNKAFYIAASMTYENFQYDKTSTEIQGREFSLIPNQTDDTLRANLSAELYFKQNLSVRYIMDLASIYRMRRQSEIEQRDLQQTLAMTYFYSRDISIAPNIRFIWDDIRDDRTNIGLTLNMNI